MKKTLLALSILGSILSFGTQAFALESLSCENGDISKVGDSHYAINVFEDGLEFLPYEGSFSIDAGDSKYANNTFTFKNVKTELSIEGEMSQVIVSGTVKISKDESKLVANLSMNRGPYQSYRMTCVKKNRD